MSQSAARWESALARWAWPDQVRAGVDTDPWQVTPSELGRANASDSPADVAALDALPRRGTVLDVGCGTGRTSAPLRRGASRITGVDPRPAMLEAFGDATAVQPNLLRRLAGGAPDVVTIEGRWPAVADEAGTADVVVAGNVLYDVTDDVAGFVRALHEAAQRRVVVTLTERHPLHWINPYAEHVHGIRRPAEPTADVAADVVREVTGTTPTLLRWTDERALPEDPDDLAALVARRACVRPEQAHDLRVALHRMPPPAVRPMVAIVWDVA